MAQLLSLLSQQTDPVAHHSVTYRLNLLPLYHFWLDVSGALPKFDGDRQHQPANFITMFDHPATFGIRMLLWNFFVNR